MRHHSREIIFLSLLKKLEFKYSFLSKTDSSLPEGQIRWLLLGLGSHQKRERKSRWQEGLSAGGVYEIQVPKFLKEKKLN